MSRLTMDMLDRAPFPRRGDLLESNVGTRMHRTWFVLGMRALKPKDGMPRCKLWIEKWWMVEPELRIRLWNSAMRRENGQQIIRFRRYPAKKRKTFEQLMRAR